MRGGHGGGVGGGGGRGQLCRCRLFGADPSVLLQTRGFRCSRWAPLPGLLLLVLFILWCTPLPRPQYSSCDRPCHELDWPMICRFKMSLEMYESMGEACGQCPANRTHCDLSQCVPGDGSRRRVMTANRMLPGPTIKVCENDIVVVEVVNRVMGQSVAVHWGGQSQREFPYMDGVAQVTQCPINTHTTFQYKFRASEAGTHLWGATGSPQAESIFGPLVVRQSEARDPHRQLFDEDVHLLTVSAFGTSILVNGHREHVSAPLVRGRRYRLRFLYAVGSPDDAVQRAGWGSVVPVTVTIPGLEMLVLTVDGHAVRPRTTNSLTLWPSERTDVVVSADRGPHDPRGQEDGEDFHVVVVQPAEGTELAQAVVKLPFKEKQNKKKEQAQLPAAEMGPKHAEVADNLSSADLEGLDPLPEKLAGNAMDVVLYLPFDFQPLAGVRSDLSGPKPPSKPGSGPAPLGPSDLPWPRAVPRMCNISMSLPAAPLLTQPREAEAYDGEGGVPVCRGNGKPATCPPNMHGKEDQSCECAHVIRIPLGSTVEVVLVDQGGDGGRAHVFHLHGYSFWVVGRGTHHGGAHHGGAHHSAHHRASAQPEMQRGSWEALAAADQEGRLLHRHLHRPVLKDTAIVPAHGAVAFRFIADNPGYWLLREQSFYRWPTGLGVILQVGDESDLPPVPSDFPKCGSFIGPGFFLM